jgi:site-specific DNA-cytosine methylase
VYHGACQEPESADVRSDRVALTLVHKQCVRAEARKQDEAGMSEDDGARESDAEAGEAGEEDDGKEDALTAVNEGAASPAARDAFAHATEHDDGDSVDRRTRLPVFEPPEGCGPDAGLFGSGRCRRCWDASAGTMVRCSACGATFHATCVAAMRRATTASAKPGEPWCCEGCEQSDGLIGRRGQHRPSVAELCAGTAAFMHALFQMARAGEIGGYVPQMSVEYNRDARRYAEQLDDICRGGITAQTATLNLLLMRPEDVQPCDLCLVSLPCVAFSSATNGRDGPKGMEHRPTGRIVRHFCGLLGLGRWGVVVFENVPKFFRSEAWRAIVAAGAAAGYRVVAVHTLYARKSGVPQSRKRGFGALSRVGPGAFDLARCWDTLAALEAKRALKLSDCLLAASDTAERRRYGITDEVLAGQRAMSDECRQRLEAVVEAAGGTVEKVCRTGAPAAVLDLGKSPGWSRPILDCGYAPTITASHGLQSLYAPHLRRFLLPIEMMMLQGFRAEQLAAAAAAFEPTSTALCRLAGNAIPTEFCLVVVRGLAICFPDLFRDTATPPEAPRRSARGY